MNTPHLIEIALLMLAAFLIGCLIGYLLRRIVGGEPSVPSASEVAPAASSSAAKSVTPTATKAESKPKEKTATGEKTAPPKAQASAKPAPKKSAAKRTTPAKSAASKTTTKKTATKAAPRKPAAKKSASSPDGKPKTLSAPKGGVKDDLKNIKGVGPKIEGILNEMGIFHFEQIAAWGRKEVKWVDEELSFRGRIDREKWIAQAKTLLKSS